MDDESALDLGLFRSAIRSDQESIEAADHDIIVEAARARIIAAVDLIERESLGKGAPARMGAALSRLAYYITDPKGEEVADVLTALESLCRSSENQLPKRHPARARWRQVERRTLRVRTAVLTRRPVPLEALIASMDSLDATAARDPKVELAQLTTRALVTLMPLLDEAQETPRRLLSIDNQTSNHVFNAFEAPLQGLVNAGQDGQIDPDQEELVKAVLQQIAIERTKGASNPQIIELPIADLIRGINGALNDRPRFEAEFVRLGVDESTAAVAADRMVEAIRLMSELGGDDREADAAKLAEIAEIAGDLDEVADSIPKKDDVDGELVRLGKKATETITTEIAKAGFNGIRTLVKDNWFKIAGGLVLAWAKVWGWIT